MCLGISTSTKKTKTKRPKHKGKGKGKGLRKSRKFFRNFEKRVGRRAYKRGDQKEVTLKKGVT